MACYSRIRRQQLMQEAEGYIDLAMCFADQWPLKANLKHRLARRALATIDQLDPQQLDHPRVLYFRGQAFRLIQRFQDAIPPLQRAYQLEPENIHLNLSLAWCYKRIGRIDLAIQSLEEALETHGDRDILHYNLACYWSLTHHVGLTLIHLARALEINPDYRDSISEEPDFDTVRNHPEFLTLTGVIV